MEQKEAVMVLFDREEEYARLLSEFLRRQKELPWEIHTYTKMEELLEREKNGKVTMLVVAESSCMDTLSTLEPACRNQNPYSDGTGNIGCESGQRGRKLNTV